MIYIKETHNHSWWPIWFRQYDDGRPNSRLTDNLIFSRKEIEKWIKESRIDCVIHKKGWNYKFSREKDFTMFLLKWS